MNWMLVFKKDISMKLKHADDEYNLYKNTNNLIYLQQACNKLFSAVENYLMLKYKKRVRSYSQLRELVKDNEYDIEILTEAVQLHYFFYNADLQMDRYTAENMFKIVRRKIKNRMRK